MKLAVDPRITFALILALFLETAGGLIWAGRAAARLDAVERAVATQPEVAERLARLEEQIVDARRSLARIERRLDRMISVLGPPALAGGDAEKVRRRGAGGPRGACHRRLRRSVRRRRPDARHRSRGRVRCEPCAAREPLPMLVEHERRLLAGYWNDVREDSRGLFLRGEIRDDQPGAARARRMIARGVDGLSIGFVPIVAHPHAKGRVLTEIELLEVSIVTHPMHFAR